MAKELSEDSKFQVSIKTLISIVVAVITVVSAYFGLMSTINSKFADLEIKVQEALERAGGQWPSGEQGQKLYDAYKAKEKELSQRYQISKDSIDRLNFPNEAKRQNALSDLEGLLFDID